ncbi:YtpR family tRNA-binding protein [Spiroplasma endosymbiont of Diplazon laetatorius]|uniref:YtpR family tRNA-binding protein n=1 Tax=Spiroplasma endosymbiont of Diplazon laetatorius TaxID=3066322 RepID=UPI0030CE06FB
MKLFSRYIKNFNTIGVLFKSKNITETKKQDNCELLFHNDEIVGINIFGFDLDKNFYLEDKELHEIIKPFVEKQIGNFDFENQFIIAKIIECEKIPDTHLSKCKVSTGKEDIQIICGASNAREGLLTTLATVGSWMPDGSQINQGKLKGFDSFGMLCSSKELGIEDNKFDKPGIMEWDLNDSYIGRSIWEVLNEK